MLFSFGLGLWVAWVCLCLVLPQNIRRTDGEGKRSAIIIIIISVDSIFLIVVTIIIVLVFAHMRCRRTRDHSCRYNGLCRAALPEGENPFETPWNAFKYFQQVFWNTRVWRIWGIYLSMWGNIFVTVGEYICPGGQIVEPNNWQKKSFAVSGGRKVGAKLAKEGLRLGQLIPFPLISPTRLCIRPTRKIEDWIS